MSVMELSPDTDFDRSVIYRTSTVFALRMGAVFMICAGTIWLRTRLLRPSAVLVTYGLASSNCWGSASASGSHLSSRPGSCWSASCS